MKHLSLDGPWRLILPGRARPVPASVPGCVHTDLMAAGILRDPFYRDNIAAGRVCADGPAVYEREFSLNPIPQHERIFLLFNGLDTFATVRVNGQVVGVADNMFRRWRFDITDVAHAGPNHVSVSFEPPGPRMAEAQRRRPLECPMRPGEPAGRTHIRKCKNDFGSDSAPNLPAMGIWRGVQVEFANCARILSVTPRQVHDGERISLDLSVACDVFGPLEDPHVVAHVLYRGLTMAEASVRLPDDGRAVLALPVRNAQLWWPNGMGEQPLYELQVELMSGRRQVDYVSRRIGFRTFRVETEDADGRPTFRLYVNDRPIFVRGANWNTPDVFESRPTRVEYARFIKAANVGNLNLLRVTGDGVYEKDYFYDLCDEYGICVWQDFMFSDAAYPIGEKAFDDNVTGELDDVITRLAPHACLAVWCGGDRLPGHVADAGAAPGEKMPRDVYENIFGRLVPAALERISPGTPYVRDSTAPGLAAVESVEHDRRAYGRDCAPFYTAFGFPSLPSPASYSGFLLEEDCDFESEVLKAHATQLHGFEPVTRMMRALFRPPRDFASAAILSQIQQGIAYKTLVEHWRRQRPRFSGAIFSHLNDSWPSLSASSLDYGGNWKCLHYFARHFYGSLLVTGVPNAKAGTVDVFVHNDSASTFSGKIRWRLIDTSGHVWREMEKAIEVPAGGPRRLGALRMGDLLAKVGPDKLLVWLRLIADDGYAPSTDCVRFVLPKALALEDPEIKAEIRKWDDHCFAVTLHATRPALWCWLDFPPSPVRLDENFVCLDPGQPIRIRVTPLDHYKLADFRKGLRIYSLYDLS